MIFMLDQLHMVVRNYGWSIVLLTVLIRAALWPLNSSQTRSMKKMQELQPKLKALQEKYKDSPQKMQEAMMSFYKENSFNPMAGCLPMLVQLPIFIGLYGALSSPHFLMETLNSHEKFLFLNNLSSTLHTHNGKSLAGEFTVGPKDTFSTDRTVRVLMTSGTTQEQDVKNTQKVLRVFPTPILPGQPVTLTLDLKEMGLTDDYRQLIKSVEATVVNNQSRELETIHFDNKNGVLSQPVKTIATAPGVHVNVGVLILIAVYGVLTLLYQRVMTGNAPKAASASPTDDPAAAAMQSPMMKLMPLMFVVMMFFIPIPAGALLYLIVTTAMMLLQSVWVHYRENQKNAKNPPAPGNQVVDIRARQLAEK